jgi:hypothetical protein
MVKRRQAVTFHLVAAAQPKLTNNDARETARQACHRVTLLPCAIVAGDTVARFETARAYRIFTVLPFHRVTICFIALRKLFGCTANKCDVRYRAHFGLKSDIA